MSQSPRPERRGLPAERERDDIEAFLRESGAEVVLTSVMDALAAARPRNAPAFIARHIQDHFAVALAPSLLGLDPPSRGVPAPPRADGGDSGSDNDADGIPRPGSASASVLDASPAEVWRRASALSSAGALEGAEWPMEAAAAASAVVERSWDEGQAVVASGDPCRFVSVSRGVLRAPDGEQDIPAGRSLGLEALASRDAGRRFEETMTAGPGGAVTLELGAAALTRAVAGAWERRRARRVEALGSVPLLRALLDADELVLLAGLCRERRCPAGSLVAAQGSPATSALVVLRGHLSLVEDRALAFEGDGRLPPELVHRASLGPGAACGADALLRARGWRASVLAWAPELDAVVSLGGPEEGAPDPVTGAVPGVVPAPVHESLAGREVGFASDCLLLEVPRDAVREACGTDLLLRCRERAPQRFAEEMGRLA